MHPAPCREHRAVQLLVAAYAFVYVAIRFRYFADCSRLDASSFAPVGIARVLSAPLPVEATWSIASVALVSAAAFAADKWPRVTGPLLFASLLWITTYRSSFGKILHTENLLVLHVGILAFARTQALRLMALATCLTYVVAGIAKLRSGGFAWIDGTALGDWLAFDALRKIELGSFHSPAAAWLAARPALLVPLSLLTLAVELGAPLALTSQRAARVWALSAWIFHVAVLATMAIGFFYPLTGVAFAPFLLRRRPSASS